MQMTHKLVMAAGRVYVIRIYYATISNNSPWQLPTSKFHSHLLCGHSQIK